MVMQSLRYAVKSPISVAMGLLLGTLAAMSGPVVLEAARDAYDARYPVWRDTSGHVQERRGDSVVIALQGTKSRACQFIRINAQTSHLDGLRPAKIQRIDMAEQGKTRPLGPQQVGMWAVIPVTPEARAVVVTVEHMCGDRLVMGKFATVRLGND